MAWQQQPVSASLPCTSVGATENLLIAAAGTPAETKITGAAAEPEISDLLALSLIHILNRAGAFFRGGAGSLSFL